MGTETIGHTVHFNLGISIVENAENLPLGRSLFHPGEECIEESVIVVWKPEAGVAAVYLLAEIGNRIFLRGNDRSDRILFGEIGLYIHLALRIKDSGKCGEVERGIVHGDAFCREEGTEACQHGDCDSQEEEYF